MGSVSPIWHMNAIGKMMVNGCGLYWIMEHPILQSHCLILGYWLALFMVSFWALFNLSDILKAWWDDHSHWEAIGFIFCLGINHQKPTKPKALSEPATATRPPPATSWCPGRGAFPQRPGTRRAAGNDSEAAGGLKGWSLWMGYLEDHRTYHLVMTHSSPWKDPPFLIGKLGKPR